MSSSPLSPAQIDAFKTDGHLILPDVIDADLLATWRDQFWSYVGCRPDEPESWPDQTGGFKPDPLFGDLPQMQAISRQLGGDRFQGGGCGVIVRWPEESRDWTIPETGHIDGYPGEGCQAVLMVGATTYLYDVEEGGGPLIYWSGSHYPTHRYFLKYPDQIEGTFRETQAFEERGWAIFSDSSPHPPRPFTASAGDVILWHGWVSHCGSSNVNDLPRVGLFARWTHKDEPKIKAAIPGDLWHYWAI